MGTLDAGVALNLFVGASLFAVMATLLLEARRLPESHVFAVFLGLVGANFLANGIAFLTSGLAWFRAAFAALALDPLFLLLFVTIFPYRRRTHRVRLLLAGMVAWAGASLALVLVVRSTTRVTYSPEHAIVILEMVVAYVAAWVLSLRAAVEAPTPHLARRSSWLAAAVGVAVVPRMALVPSDVSLVGLLRPLVSPPSYLFLETVVGVVLAAGCYGIGRWELRRRGMGVPPHLVTPLRVVVAIAAALVGLQMLVSLLDTPLRLVVPYGLRWLVFAAILGYGIMAYQVVEFRRAADHVLPALGAAIAGIGALLATLSFALGEGVEVGLAAPMAVAVGLAATLPAARLTRAAVYRVGPGTHAEGAERRLALYRAALEAAWARGPPDAEARRRLERDRRTFGVTHEEARTLEHVVVGSMAAPGEKVRAGQEVAPGLVVERRLGEGAHGGVYVARSYPRGDLVVVKELHSDAAGPRELRSRLLRESRALQRLAHPHIVPLLEVQVHGGRSLLVMEHVDAEPLSSLLARGPLPPDRVRALAEQLLDALGAAHAAGVVHRDVKPSNILVDRGGRFLLTDFGLATVEGDAEAVRATVSGLDALGGLSGTLAYMAPEQARGERATPRSDLYSLGLVLYEALSGKPALDVDGLRLYDALEQAANPRIRLDVLPTGWRVPLRKALTQEPSGRFDSAKEMREALSAIGKHSGAPAA